MTTIKAIRLEFTNHWFIQKQQLQRQFNRKLEQTAVALVSWLLSKRAVQDVVADTFGGNTPLCNVLNRAIESKIEENNRTVDADDIEGLDSAVEREVESALSGRDFADAVKDAIDLEEVAQSIDFEEHIDMEAIADAVAEVLARRLRGR